MIGACPFVEGVQSSLLYQAHHILCSSTNTVKYSTKTLGTREILDALC
jgi:hypothetical protein